MRLAGLDDVAHIVAMGGRYHDEKRQDFAYIPEDFAEYIAGLIEAPNALVLVTDAGFLAAAAMGAPQNKKHITAYEVFWWSEDRQGKQLLACFEEWARGQGARRSVVSFPVGTPTVQKMLERDGYELSELMMKKEF